MIVKKIACPSYTHFYTNDREENSVSFVYPLFVSYGLSKRKAAKEAGLFTPKGTSTHILSMSVCLSLVSAICLYSENEYKDFAMF
jgi:hypothetical protein